MGESGHAEGASSPAPPHHGNRCAQCEALALVMGSTEHSEGHKRIDTCLLVG